MEGRRGERREYIPELPPEQVSRRDRGDRMSEAEPVADASVGGDGSARYSAQCVSAHGEGPAVKPVRNRGGTTKTPSSPVAAEVFAMEGFFHLV